MTQWSSIRGTECSPAPAPPGNTPRAPGGTARQAAIGRPRAHCAVGTSVFPVEKSCFCEESSDVDRREALKDFFPPAPPHEAEEIRDYSRTHTGVSLQCIWHVIGRRYGAWR